MSMLASVGQINGARSSQRRIRALPHVEKRHLAESAVRNPFVIPG